MIFGLHSIQLIVFVKLSRHADTMFEAFLCDGAIQYNYLRNILPMMSILIYEYGKYRIESLRERVGIMMYGCTFWYLVGLASEVVLAKQGVKNKKSKKKQSNEEKKDNTNQANKDENPNVLNQSNVSNVLNDISNESNVLNHISNLSNTSNVYNASNDENVDPNNLNNNNNNNNNDNDINTDQTHVDDTQIDALVDDLNQINMDVNVIGSINDDDDDSVFKEVRYFDCEDDIDDTECITAGAVNAREPDSDDVPRYNNNRYFHLSHKGGNPFRDFSLLLPCLIFQTSWGPGMYDEGHEEAQLAFQSWCKIRKQLMDRLPMEQCLQQQNKRGYLSQPCKSMGYEKSKYITDTRFVMRDLHVDQRMLSLSPRFLPAIKLAITIMSNIEEYKLRANTEESDVKYNQDTHIKDVDDIENKDIENTDIQHVQDIDEMRRLRVQSKQEIDDDSSSEAEIKISNDNKKGSEIKNVNKTDNDKDKNNNIKNNDKVSNLFDMFTFYSNGSFVVHCSVDPNVSDQEALLISTTMNCDTNAENCSYERWLETAHILKQKADDAAKEYKDSLHLPSRVIRGKT